MSWALLSGLVLLAALLGGVVWFERSHPPARLVALVATLGALSGLGRDAFAALPSVKPTTAMVLVAGAALGPAPGFAVGALAALSSNVFLGQGPWTPWQMALWGLVGVAGAALGSVTAQRPPRALLAVVAAVCAIVFSEGMNFSLVSLSGGPVLGQFSTLAAAGLPFDIVHAVSSAVFTAVFGPELLRVLLRFGLRLHVSWPGAVVEAPGARPTPSGRSIAPLALALGGGLVALTAGLALPARAAAASPTSYLLSAQNADGGFGAAPGARSDPLFTAWAALGLAAAGHNPADVHRGGASALTALRAQARGVSSPADLERTLLVAGAAGVGPRGVVPGRDLGAELLGAQAGDGSFSGQVNVTAFGILALPGTGRGRLAAAGRWLAAQQNSDGGFGFARRGGASDVDDTGAVLEALVVAGRGGTHASARALRYLRIQQDPDGGLPASPGAGSNAQSTAFAIQGMIAAGQDPARIVARSGRSPLGYLRGLIAPDGSVRYSRSSPQTPVWVTGQALLALQRRAFPLARVPRRRSVTAALGGSAGGLAPAGGRAHQSTRAGARTGGGRRGPDWSGLARATGLWVGYVL